MSRRYDGRTTTFSPEGRLYQVEYAMEAISHAGASLGILATNGIVLAAERKIVSKLLDNEKKSEKMYKLDDHICCSVAGITADANILIQYARVASQRYMYAYQENIPVENLVKEVCNIKQGYTQFGGQRPFGVSFLYAGYDKFYGFQLYHSDPSGNYGGWKATAIGQNNQNAQSLLKQEWKNTLTVNESLTLALKVMSKTMDNTILSTDKLEFSTLTLDENKEIVYHLLTNSEIETLIKVKEDLDKKRKRKRKKRRI